jgi:hypothetical protein
MQIEVACEGECGERERPGGLKAEVLATLNPNLRPSAFRPRQNCRRAWLVRLIWLILSIRLVYSLNDEYG